MPPVLGKSDFDLFPEDLARKFPFPENPGYWKPIRRRDGTSVKP